MQSIRPTRTIRIAVAGLGYRGMATLKRYRLHPELVITALSDTDTAALDAAVRELESEGRPLPATYTDWSAMVRDGAADLYVICTPRSTHARMACEAMMAGRDVAVEVPVATTVSDCREVVRVATETGRYFTMLENCCFDPFALNTEHIVAEGLIGEIVHCEGAYIHDLHDRPTFLADMLADAPGNAYPTHGLGPVCRLLDIEGKDTLDYLVAVDSAAAGDCLVSNALIRSKRGRSVLLQLDVTTPRPYSRLQTVCGTRGYISKYPVETVQLKGMEPLTGKELEEWMAAHRHPWVEKYAPMAERDGSDNLMNYIMDRRMIETYLGSKTPDIGVHEAALWSAVTEYTATSAREGGRPVTIEAF